MTLLLENKSWLGVLGFFCIIILNCVIFSLFLKCKYIYIYCFVLFLVLVFNWTPEELAQLITNLSACLPRNDNVKYTTLIDKLDWEKVRFGQYTAAQCKEKWMQIVTKVGSEIFCFFFIFVYRIIYKLIHFCYYL